MYSIVPIIHIIIVQGRTGNSMNVHFIEIPLTTMIRYHGDNKLLKLIKVDLAYLSACGKHLQLSTYDRDMVLR